MADITAIPEKMPFHEQREAVRELGMDLDVRPASPGMAGTHVRVRPKFDRWAVKFEFDILDKSILENEELVRDILERCTFGNYIPFRGGTFGVPEEFNFVIDGKAKK